MFKNSTNTKQFDILSYDNDNNNINNDVIIEKNIPCNCGKIWIKLVAKEVEYLDIPSVKSCPKKHFMHPYFVHDDNGDYIALKSICSNESDGKYVYFCTKCRHTVTNE